MIHVIPINDLRDHEESAECWCHPSPDDECDDVMVHNAMDGRELIETGQAKIH